MSWIGADRTWATVPTKWGPYMRILPITFDTPMFWSTEELEELQGTAVIDKIGRDDAERAYSEQLIPAIKVSAYSTSCLEFYSSIQHLSLDIPLLSFHLPIIGNVSRWTDDDEVEEDKDHDGEAREGGSDVDEAEDPHPSTSIESSMQIDDTHPRPFLSEHAKEGLDSGSEDDEEEDPSDVAMVPMADLLNARWGSENARLFYEPFVLRMTATRDIKQGEQIFNTYGDPPNSDLLRRYGHVDLIRLHTSSSAPTPDEHGDVEMKEGDTDVETILHFGNPSDVTEIQADLVVHVVRATNFGSKAKEARARIEWWLDEGEDEYVSLSPPLLVPLEFKRILTLSILSFSTFVLSLPEPGARLSGILPPALISLTRLLILSEPDFESARSKGKLPKGNLRNVDVKDNKEVLEILDEVFRQREGMYMGGSVEDDEGLLSVPETLTKRRRHAVIVRLGEKRILRDVRQALPVMLAEVNTVSGVGHGDEKGDTKRDKKGGNGGTETGSSRKRAVNRAEGDRGCKKARK
ncbi:hypothetical protein J3R83DRAFT_3877 [Lanmaoa asiatica]|nr:hypothetical protein J3R83DRAFT_3877 [Lanmaoa asiatica]